MELRDYLKQHNISEEGFAALSGGAFSASAVRKWRYGDRTPRPHHLRVIAALTHGNVTANDFLGIRPSNDEAAA